MRCLSDAHVCQKMAYSKFTFIKCNRGRVHINSNPTKLLLSIESDRGKMFVADSFVPYNLMSK